jgi:hypothetical protein
MASQHDPPVQFAVAAKFSQKLFNNLGAIEFRALKLPLGEEPEIGAILRGSLNSRSLDFGGCVIYYAYEPLFRVAGASRGNSTRALGEAATLATAWPFALLQTSFAVMGLPRRKQAT